MRRSFFKMASLKSPAFLSALFVFSCVLCIGYASGGKLFLGAKHCGECHEKQYKQWLSSPHASAYSSLPASKREDIACLWCHSTDARFNFDKYQLKAVQCEACHGIGTEDAFGVFIDNFIDLHKAGLRKQSVEVCKECHFEESSPSMGEFVYSEKIKLIKHWD